VLRGKPKGKIKGDHCSANLIAEKRCDCANWGLEKPGGGVYEERAPTVCGVLKGVRRHFSLRGVYGHMRG